MHFSLGFYDSLTQDPRHLPEGKQRLQTLKLSQIIVPFHDGCQTALRCCGWAAWLMSYVFRMPRGATEHAEPRRCGRELRDMPTNANNEIVHICCYYGFLDKSKESSKARYHEIGVFILTSLWE